MLRKAQLITIAPGLGPEAGVEVILRRYNGFYPDVLWESGIQCFAKLLRFPSEWEGHPNDLPGGVDTAVRSASGQHRAPGAGQALQGGLHLTLDSPAPGLKLPPQEIGSVVVDG